MCVCVCVCVCDTGKVTDVHSGCGNHSPTTVFCSGKPSPLPPVPELVRLSIKKLVDYRPEEEEEEEEAVLLQRIMVRWNHASGQGSGAIEHIKVDNSPDSL